MAENKVVNITQLEADLTSIANTIRGKSGGSDALTFPGGFVEAITNLEIGGGLPSGISALSAGSFKPASDITGTLAIEHGLGVVPNFFVVVARDESSSDQSINSQHSATVIQAYIRNRFYDKQSSRYYYEAISGLYATSYYAPYRNFGSTTSNVYYYVSDTTFTVEAYSGTYPFLTRYTYYWICGVIDGIGSEEK